MEEDVVANAQKTLTIVTISLLHSKHNDASASAPMVTMSAPDTSGLGMRSFVHSMTQTKPFRRWIKCRLWMYSVSEVKCCVGSEVLCKQHVTPSIALTTCCQNDGDGPERDGPARDDPEKDEPERDDQLSMSGKNQLSMSPDEQVYIRRHN